MVWNRTLQKAEEIAREFGFGQAVADWRQIAESPDIDAVVIATPPGTHHEMTLACLAAGKHVLCQARMSRNLKEAHEMRDAAAASGKVACLYPPFPGLKGDRAMLRLLHDEDYIGELREARVVGMAAPAARESYDWRRDPDVERPPPPDHGHVGRGAEPLGRPRHVPRREGRVPLRQSEKLGR